MIEEKLASSTWTDEKGITSTFTWYPGDSLEEFQPFTQVYGVCFNDEGKILIQRRGKRPWCLAGGTVEAGESAEDTLRRELIEEADVSLKNPILLGGQRVSVDGYDTSYQLRYYCEVNEILPQTPDPDTNIINERKFVSPSEINEYLRWGATGEAIFTQATSLREKIHSD